MSYQRDRAKSDLITPQIRGILSKLPLSHFAEVQDAPVEMDMKHATDLTLRITGGDIAARLRFPPCKWRQLTIRAHRDSGAETELAKILNGFAYRYFYGWVDRLNVLSEWMLVDLNKARATDLLSKKRPLIDNHDGTYFVAIEVDELRSTGCLLASQIMPVQQRNVNPQVSLVEGIERAKRANYHNPRSGGAI